MTTATKNQLLLPFPAKYSRSKPIISSISYINQNLRDQLVTNCNLQHREAVTADMISKPLKFAVSLTLAATIHVALQ